MCLPRCEVAPLAASSTVPGICEMQSPGAPSVFPARYSVHQRPWAISLHPLRIQIPTKIESLLSFCLAEHQPSKRQESRHDIRYDTM